MGHGVPCCSDRGQSESVGIILLVAVVVILVVGSGAVVIAQWQSEADRETQINVQSDLTTTNQNGQTTTNLTLKHMGGDSLPPEDVLVTLQGADWERMLDNDSAFRGDGDRFRAGSRWEYVDNSLDIEGEVTLRVFDTSTNTLLHQKTYDVSE